MVEKEHCPVVRKWLERKGYYCGGFVVDSKGNPIYYQDKGTARLRVDVAGIKNVGSRVSDEIEVVAVEVRDIKNVSVRDIHDAYAYARYAHKCYLATTAPISKQDKKDAQKLGVGLLHVRNQRVTEVLSPQSKTPDCSLMMKFLNVLNVAKCSICGMFFETYVVKDEDYKSFHRLVRPKYFEAVRNNPKADVFDSEELTRIKTSYLTYGYICRTCLEGFFPGKIGEFHAVYDKEEQGFLCRMGSRNHNLEVFDVGEIVEHLKDEHNVDPKDQNIKGWTEKFEQQAKKYLRAHRREKSR